MYYLTQKAFNAWTNAANWLEKFTIPEKANFDIKYIGNHNGDHLPEVDHYCGTSACALGWLGINGVLGLEIRWDGNRHQSSGNRL